MSDLSIFILALYLIVTLLVGAAAVGGLGVAIDRGDRDRARLHARVTLLCWAWPLALPWLLWTLVRWAR